MHPAKVAFRRCPPVTVAGVSLPEWTHRAILAAAAQGFKLGHYPRPAPLTTAPPPSNRTGVSEPSPAPTQGALYEIIRGPWCWLGKVGEVLSVRNGDILLLVRAPEGEGSRVLKYRLWLSVTAVKATAAKVAA